MEELIMRIINLLNFNLRVLRNSDERDSSWMLFPSAASNYGVNLDGLNGDEVENAVVDNVYVVDVVRNTKLPAPEANTVFIVPAEIALAAVGRNDLVFPCQPMYKKDAAGNDIVTPPDQTGYTYLARAIDSQN